MDLSTLTENFNRDVPIDTFKSLIWTERYASEGDFVLTIEDTPANRANFPEGRFLGIQQSREVMIVEIVEAEDGILTISGPSLSGFLRQRMARDTWSNGYTYWPLTGAPGWIAAEIVKQMCVVGNGLLMDDNYVLTNGAPELIPYLEIGPTASGSSVQIGVEYSDVYTAVKTVCDAYGLGFALYPSDITPTTHKLIFTTYEGRDLTSAQDTYDVVRFEPALDSLVGMKEFRSIAGYKNVAYSWAPNIVAQNYFVGKAYAPGTSDSTIGFKRRTLMVLAEDINDADVVNGAAQLNAILLQRAKDALANNNYVRLADGQIVPQSGYDYGTHFSLGDIIELRASSGLPSLARVSEFIRTQDGTGYKAYPTLSVISE